MKEIQLTQGKTTLVDDEDFEWLSQYKWCVRKDRKTCYAYINITIQSQNKDQNIKYKLKRLLIHRVIIERKLGRELTSEEWIDHIDHNGLNNQQSNLRICNMSQNGGNSIKQKYYAKKPTTSKYKGVYWHKRDQKWEAHIRVNGKKIYLGRFINEVEAAKAYDIAASKYFGQFANFNISYGVKNHGMQQ